MHEARRSRGSIKRRPSPRRPWERAVKLGDVPRAFVHAPIEDRMIVTPPTEWDLFLIDNGNPVMDDEQWILTKAMHRLRKSAVQWDTHFADVRRDLRSLS